jgi:hypothetical protein
MVLENRPGDCCSTEFDSEQRDKPDVRHKPITLTKNALSNRSLIETLQGGTLLDDEAGPLEKGSSVR